MIHLDVVQGQADWHWHRLGIPTASNFDRILTPKKREYAAGATTYIHELCAEWLTGIPTGVEVSAFMERGTDMEASAVAWYELQTGLTTSPGGVCLRDDRLVACSPDRLVGDRRGAEVKVPSARVHIANLLNGTDAHFAQIQGNLWLTERDSWDLVSFNPTMPSILVTVGRDEQYIAALAKAMERFLHELQVAKNALLALGAVPAKALAVEFASSLAMRPDAEDPF